MASTFGRKGLAEAEEIARTREAFIAAERARSAAEPIGGGPQQPITARPATPSMPRPAALSYRGSAPEKSLAIAYLLWFIVGGISAHRFYLGAWRSALAQIGCLFGGLFIMVVGSLDASTMAVRILGAGLILFAWLWMLADVFLIPSVRRRMREKQATDVHAVFG